VLLIIMLGWHLHCGALQRLTSLRVGLLIGVLMATNCAVYCTEVGNKHCIVDYDGSLSAFYALAEGNWPWLVKMWAGVTAFAFAAVLLTCVFAAACIVTERVRKWVVCQRCGSRRQLLQLMCLQAKCCGHLVGKVPSNVH
jgi:hypothetical protein